MSLGPESTLLATLAALAAGGGSKRSLSGCGSLPEHHGLLKAQAIGQVRPIPGVVAHAPEPLLVATLADRCHEELGARRCTDSRAGNCQMVASG